MTREEYLRKKEVLEKALEFLKREYVSQMPPPKFKPELKSISYKPDGDTWGDEYIGEI